MRIAGVAQQQQLLARGVAGGAPPESLLNTFSLDLTSEGPMSFPGQHLQRCWHLVDAQGQTVGRLASQIANILNGKHKPTFLPNKDRGDYVVVVNAEKVRAGTSWRTVSDGKR